MRSPLAALLVAGASVACGCVGAPTAREWMGVGFRAPEQALSTFQVAIRADEPELEYRCFSSGFRERHGITKLAWIHVREELRSQYPWMRRGLVDAELEAPIAVMADRARAVWVTHGYQIRVGLVREDFVEAYGPTGLVHDDYRPFEESTGVQKSPDGSRWVYGRFPLPAHVDERAGLTELRIGREWKIDSFETVSPETDAPP